MKTPCVAACKNVDGICSGCHRTMTEIIEWKQYSDEQREIILQRLKGANETHRCPSCNEPVFCGISAGENTCWCMGLERRDTSLIVPSDSLCLCRECLRKAKLLNIDE
ncbi:cysteine-rich CWC family protein [Vibrio sp. RC27]